jgi:uncharacterized OB-fold protein
MAMQQLLKPELYAADPSQAGVAVLRGGRCKCGHVFFPMQRYGCEKCGRATADLQTVDLKGQGVLAASVTVHLHARPERVAPFTVGSIKLDDGPVLRALLTGPLDNLAPGCRMVATLTAVGSTDGMLDLRFMATREP